MPSTGRGTAKEREHVTVHSRDRNTQIGTNGDARLARIRGAKVASARDAPGAAGGHPELIHAYTGATGRVGAAVPITLSQSGIV
jgi:hypothetical protein